MDGQQDRTGRLQNHQTGKNECRWRRREKTTPLLKKFGSAFLRKTLVSGLLADGLCCKGSRWLVDAFMAALSVIVFWGGDQFLQRWVLCTSPEWETIPESGGLPIGFLGVRSRKEPGFLESWPLTFLSPPGLLLWLKSLQPAEWREPNCTGLRGWGPTLLCRNFYLPQFSAFFLPFCCP